MKRFLIPAVLALAAGCVPTAQQVQTVSTYQQAIATACGTAMALAPLAGPIAPWIVGGCSTEAAIAKLALDPSSLAWVQGLIAKAKGGA